MPTELVERMLEVAYRPLEVVDLEAELAKLPACESTSHPIARWGHEPTQPAEFFVMAPCRTAWMVCRGWLTSMLGWEEFRCTRDTVGGCGESHYTTDVVYFPLNLGDR